MGVHLGGVAVEEVTEVVERCGAHLLDLEGLRKREGGGGNRGRVGERTNGMGGERLGGNVCCSKVRPL